MTQEGSRRMLVELGASLFARGYSVGSAGNISVRVEGGYLVTPTNSSLGRLSVETISFVDDNWSHRSGDRPSKEVVMHRAIYEARPDAGAVVHLHSTYVTALSCLAEEGSQQMTPLTPYTVMRLGEHVATVPYFRPGDPEMETAIFEAAGKSSAIILSNHGSLVSAATLVDAVNAAEELEASAELTFVLEGKPTRELTKPQISDLLSM